MVKKTTRLREIIENDETYVVPGAFNALTAKLIEEAGFPVGYVTGAGVSNSMLGIADVGLMTFKEIVDQVGYISDNTSIPFIVDGDTGFGNAVNTFRTVKLYEKAGAAGIQLEDQVFPKKCGHFVGKQVITTGEMVGKIKAAADAREDSNFVIIARTDSRAIHGVEESIERSLAYVDAGADVIFVEAPKSVEEIELISQRLSGIPLILNIVEGGFTPSITKQDAERLGFKFVLYANAALRGAVKSVQNVYKHLKETGSTNHILDELITMEERNRVTHLPLLRKIEEQYSDDKQEGEVRA